MDMQGDKRRGKMEIFSTGREGSRDPLNCPLLFQANGLGRMALDRLFGEGRWNFVTFNRSDSVVTERLKSEPSSPPLF